MDNREVAFMYKDGSMQSLGLPQGGSRSGANDVNESGTAVGWGNNTIDFKDYALVFAGSATAICEGSANAINGLGQIVGQSKTSSGQSMAFLYDAGQVIDLNTRLGDSGQGYWLFSAEDINDSGQILATAWGPVGYFHSVILTPVPEPSGLMLVTIGFVLVLRRRQ